MTLIKACLAIFIGITAYHANGQLCTLQTHAEWENLERRPSTSQRFGSKLILVGTLSFKKRAHEPIILEHLHLQWHGAYIETLSTSLYHKKNNQKFIPLEDNLICDGVWNKEKQRIIFKFNKPYGLSAHTQFYVVLSIPADIEAAMKTGWLSIEKNSMPEMIQCCIPDKACILRMAHADRTSTASTISQ